MLGDGPDVCDPTFDKNIDKRAMYPQAKFTLQGGILYSASKKDN